MGAENGIDIIDSHYLDQTDNTSCYLVVDSGEAAVIETNTNNAVPYILAAIGRRGLTPEQVKYVVVTHIHLDHAGGTGQLMTQLPNARLLVHPRGKKHLIDPEKLISSAKSVYGEEKFKRLYGDILPIPGERVIAAADGEQFTLGERTLEIFEMRGHAKHHFVVFDRSTGSLFSGDNFGIGYPVVSGKEFRLIFPSTSPTQFEPDKAMETFEQIVSLRPQQVYLTHFGALVDDRSADSPEVQLERVHRQLSAWIDFSLSIVGCRYQEGYRDQALTDQLFKDIMTEMGRVTVEGRGTPLTEAEKELLALDVDINAQGLTHYINKLNEEK